MRRRPSRPPPRLSVPLVRRARLLLEGLIVLASIPLPAGAGNPLFRAADPHAVVIDHQVWIYPTGGGRGQQFFAWASSDLVRWDRRGPILDFANIPSFKEDKAPTHSAWAPGLALRNKKMYLYYSVGPQNPTPSRIGVAVAENPAGPFQDSGRPLLAGGHGFEAIDPMVFEDPATKKWYLYAGGSAGATLRVFEMNDDMTSLARQIKVATPPQFTEGVFMHVRRGTYYLSYSHGNWRDATYSVHYATAPSPIGPWTYRGPILESNAKHKGPGHHSVFYLPGLDQWFIVYHRYNNRSGNGPFDGPREVCIDRLDYNADGLLRKVEMTDTGVSLEKK